MTAYILKLDALRAIQKQRCANTSPAQNFMLDRIRCDIVTLPAADVAEVVRCKDCAHFGNLLRDGLHACCLYVMPYCRPDDFCSRGVRKGWR